ncbi:MAG: hypothetical protein A2W25_11560 [candidate division Zixibacteria bacterium RBG_16_53_22]|nr:MAG: hypothetical protein A2W25_11560 [candidate division Zixibacteria bacterium RBG_16_53_22]
MTKKDNQRYDQPQTISHFIYSKLKEEIINKDLIPDQRINEHDIATRFRVSRTPVREAVLRLASEGFVTVDSYRRATVRAISFEELEEILVVLAVLDRIAVRGAIEHISQKGIHRIERLTAKMEKYCSPKTQQKYREINREIHNELWKYVPNKYLLEIIQLVIDRIQLCSYALILVHKNPAFLDRSMKHHWELLAAIKAKDGERLMDLMFEHRLLILEFITKKNHTDAASNPPAGDMR